MTKYNKDIFKKHSGWGEDISDFIIELVKVVIISLIVIVPVRYFLIQPFYVKGASMEPNFYDHEYLIIDEISYRLEMPQRGDIVVFKYPQDPSQYFIKRVIGLPDERIIVKDGGVYLYDENKKQEILLDERDYLSATVLTPGRIDIELGEGEYFVLGDNRSSSLDSRTFGPIAEPFIVGKAWIRGWPFNKIKIFNNPSYNL
ncbi:MAG: signal peptidase I [Patescibacteria group bacterium]|nr:signal peptidase I [Patescibacteria group bacterium]MDD5490237.1 signal peptidase I [Patescibacteria group bacterium]